ncbi:helix-turn-helix domain-containing protein [Candidatus Entotheonella palauensis]|uniref:Uncharacterized protein n=1 Tax=Candidatus Entotheonella gemina TaxID=1429439 RepID=W4M508_9BACT|nr:hypothetical protein [Candidatus Entotheonella palauensis]ETX05268.1 MAG: hypothetical protein ETSY2_23975 [Candidatus Entotheonella gemina]
MSTSKHADWLTPERRAEHARIREEIKAELPEIREHARNKHEKHMREGTPPSKARWVLTSERHRQGLSDEDMMARSGLDATALASMYGLDARPTIETMEAYARALGKKLLIVLAEDGGEKD